MNGTMVLGFVFIQIMHWDTFLDTITLVFPIGYGPTRTRRPTMSTNEGIATTTYPGNLTLATTNDWIVVTPRQFVIITIQSTCTICIDVKRLLQRGRKA